MAFAVLIISEGFEYIMVTQFLEGAIKEFYGFERIWLVGTEQLP